MSDTGLYYTPPALLGDVRIVDIAEGTGNALLRAIQEMQQYVRAADIALSNPPFGATGKTLPSDDLVRRLAQRRGEVQP